MQRFEVATEGFVKIRWSLFFAFRLVLLISDSFSWFLLLQPHAEVKAKGTNIWYQLHMTCAHHTSFMQQVAGSRSTEIWTPWKPGAWRRARCSRQKSWACHWEFQLVFVGALSGNMVDSAMHVHIRMLNMIICMHKAPWNLKLLVSDHWKAILKPRVPEVVLSVDKKCWTKGTAVRGDRSAEAQNFRTFWDFRSEEWARLAWSLKIVCFYFLMKQNPSSAVLSFFLCMGLQLMGQFRYLAGIEFDCRTQNVNDIPWYEWHEQSCPQFETLRCSLGPLSGRQRKTWKSAREFRWISLIWMKSITKSMRCCDSSFPFEAALLKVALRVGVSEQGKDFRRVPAICTVSEIDPMLYRASVSRSVLDRTACIIVRKYIYTWFLLYVSWNIVHIHIILYTIIVYI